MSEDAVIRRGVRNVRFTMVANATLEDDRLSIEARWLISYLLSKPDNWIIRPRDLKKKSGRGRDKVRAMMKELEEAGYLVREKVRENGKFKPDSFVINDDPATPEPAQTASDTGDIDGVASLPQPEKPATAEPAPVEPAPVNPPLSNTEEIVKLTSDLREGAREGVDWKEVQPPPVSDRTAQQVDKLFWKLVKDWPQLKGMPKTQAKAAFDQLSDDEQDAAIAKRDGWIALLKSQGKDHIPAPSTYCKERLWQDVPADMGKAEKAECGVAKPYGKMWGAVRMVDLMREPYGHFPKMTIMQQKLMEQGGPIADRELLERKSRYGWPKVNTMHERAIRKHAGVSADPSLAGIADLFGKFEKGSNCWEAWKEYHEQRGWPWFGADRDCPDWVWMPDPPEPPYTYDSPQEAVRAAMARFETEHATITERQAAE